MVSMISGVMVLSLAITELFPESTLRIEHPISKGYYCGLDNFDKAITPEIIETIKAKVDEIIQQGRKIVCEEKQTMVVKELFSKQKKSKGQIISFRNTRQSILSVLQNRRLYRLLQWSTFTIYRLFRAV
jgi:threonyl-tRNA synthetase